MIGKPSRRSIHLACGVQDAILFCLKKNFKMGNGTVETNLVSANVVSTKRKKKERRFVATVAVYGKAKG